MKTENPQLIGNGHSTDTQQFPYVLLEQDYYHYLRSGQAEEAAKIFPILVSAPNFWSNERTRSEALKCGVRDDSK